jgi:hypothetical protein
MVCLTIAAQGKGETKNVPLKRDSVLPPFRFNIWLRVIVFAENHKKASSAVAVNLIRQ